MLQLFGLLLQMGELLDTFPVTFLPHTGLEFQTVPVFRKQCFKLLMHDVFFCSPFP